MIDWGARGLVVPLESVAVGDGRHTPLRLVEREGVLLVDHGTLPPPPNWPEERRRNRVAPETVVWERDISRPTGLDGEVRHLACVEGRGPEREDLAQARGVENHPLTVVLGASGTEKSSAVKAGLVPRLKREVSGLRSRGSRAHPGVRVDQSPPHDWEI